MVDNRSAGFFGIGGSFNFKSGDISGTAAKMQDDKGEGQAEGQEKYMDRRAVLRATLNSLAMMNVANVINAKKIALQNDSKKKKVDEKSLKHNENPFKSDENEHIDDVVD